MYRPISRIRQNKNNEKKKKLLFIAILIFGGNQPQLEIIHVTYNMCKVSGEKSSRNKLL